MELFGSSSTPASAASTNEHADLLGDLFGGGASSKASAPVTSPNMASNMNTNALADLFGGTPSSAPTISSKSYTCYSKNSLLITLTPTRIPGTDNLKIVANFSNSGSSPITSLGFQVAVPKSLKLKLMPISNNTVAPGSKETQNLQIENPSKVLLDN